MCSVKMHDFPFHEQEKSDVMMLGWYDIFSIAGFYSQTGPGSLQTAVPTNRSFLQYV